jgi:large subunit ribosomal protein L17
VRHRIAGRQLGRPTDQRLSLYRNLIIDLLRYEKIQTTEAKAKAIQGQAERLITLAKKGDVAARRLAIARLGNVEIVEKLFTLIAPKYTDRPGGYTRIIKLGPRLGDAAPMSIIQLVE